MSVHSPARALSTNDRIDHIDPIMKEVIPLEGDSDTSSSYSDDEGSETSTPSSTGQNGMGTGVWSKEEHAKFLEAIKMYSNGPWKLVAAFVGTRTVRQTMTHAQKYRQKAARRLRGLRTKQALMRMHFGHHVSEESLVQERLRAINAASNRHFACEPINYPFLIVPAEQSAPHSSYQALTAERLETREVPSYSSDSGFDIEMESTSWVFPQPAEELTHLDAAALDAEDVGLLEDLKASPTLEECAAELLKLLF